jgi:hypothetical protein
VWPKCVSYLWRSIPIPQSGHQLSFLYSMDGLSDIVLDCYEGKHANPFQHLKSDLSDLFEG